MSRSRNSKDRQKPPKAFKKVMKRRRKAKERQTFKTGKEVPEFPKTDTYNYN